MLSLALERLGLTIRWVALVGSRHHARFDCGSSLWGRALLSLALRAFGLDHCWVALVGSREFISCAYQSGRASRAGLRPSGRLRGEPPGCLWLAPIGTSLVVSGAGALGDLWLGIGGVGGVWRCLAWDRRRRRSRSLSRLSAKLRGLGGPAGPELILTRRFIP